MRRSGVRLERRRQGTCTREPCTISSSRTKRWPTTGVL